MRIGGMDPGDKGCFVVLNENGDIAGMRDMPVIKGKGTELVVPEFFLMLQGAAIDRLYIEKMTPGQFSLANFKKGGYLYATRVACFALGIPLVEVPPKDWQKAFKIKNNRNDPENTTKHQSCAVASRIWPSEPFYENGPRKGLKLLDGKADAALIAEYGRLKENGQNMPNNAKNKGAASR